MSKLTKAQLAALIDFSRRGIFVSEVQDRVIWQLVNKGSVSLINHTYAITERGKAEVEAWKQKVENK